MGREASLHSEAMQDFWNKERLKLISSFNCDNAIYLLSSIKLIDFQYLQLIVFIENSMK
jgi:hypothetical protein